MDSAFDTVVLTVLSSGVSAFLAWFATRNKNQADLEKVKEEAKQIELENVQTAISIWRQMAEGFAPEVKQLRVEINLLRLENEQLKKQIDKLERLLGSQVK